MVAEEEEGSVGEWEPADRRPTRWTAQAKHSVGSLIQRLTVGGGGVSMTLPMEIPTLSTGGDTFRRVALSSMAERSRAGRLWVLCLARVSAIFLDTDPF